MKVVTVAVIGWTFYLVAAQEKVCSTSCSTVGMIQSTPGNLVVTSTNPIRLPEEHLVTTGSILILVYDKSIVIWN